MRLVARLLCVSASACVARAMGRHRHTAFGLSATDADNQMSKYR
jgi:hypothetical protein